MKPAGTENDLKRVILDYLAARKIFHWRNQTGALPVSYKGKSRLVRFGVTGSADIMILELGVFYAVELKAPGKKPTAAQEAWLQKVRDNGGDAVWFDNFERFLEWWEG
jgi:hypothetical protein